MTESHLDTRLTDLTVWAGQVLGNDVLHIVPASADASFRRYFRIVQGANSYVAMDAPPDKEDVRPFLHVAHLMQAAGVNVPRIIAEDVTRGYLLLSDLG